MRLKFLSPTEVILPCHVILGGIWDALLGGPVPRGIATGSALTLFSRK